MLTLSHARTMSQAALDWTSQDIRDALANVRAFIDARIPYDEKRASEYADELSIIATVRQERATRPTCPTCGHIL